MPAPDWWGVEPQRITVGKSTFDVRVRGSAAQAIRVNTEWAPRLEAVAPRAMAAIEQVSGCEVTRLDGDAAVIDARIKCGKAAAPLPPVTAWDCQAETYEGRLLGGTVGMTCLPVR